MRYLPFATMLISSGIVGSAMPSSYLGWLGLLAIIPMAMFAGIGAAEVEMLLVRRRGGDMR